MAKKGFKGVKFTHSPTGSKFRLAFNAGDEVDLPEKLADQVIGAGLAKPYGDKEKAAAKKAVEAAEKATNPAAAKAEKR